MSQRCSKYSQVQLFSESIHIQMVTEKNPHPQKNNDRRNVGSNELFLCLDSWGSITESFIENVKKVLNVNVVFTLTERYRKHRS